MIRRILIMAAFALAALVAFAEGPGIEFKDTKHDMGIIKAADGKVTHKYEFTNPGTAPLVIKTAFGSCDCAKIKYPTKPIAPGSEGTISVTYDPRSKSGEVSATITVITNVKEAPRHKLLLIGAVVPKKKR